MPKAAGTSFGEALKAEYGDRVSFDYGDLAEFTHPLAVARQKESAAKVRSRREELVSRFDIIHGHFVADKYIGLFPQGEFVAIFRDPYEQALSDYSYLTNWYAHNPGAQNEIVALFHRMKPSFAEYVAWEVISNPQNKLMGSLSIDDLALVGVAEEYERSVALFNVRFGRQVQSALRLNKAILTAQRDRPKATPNWRQLVERYREADITLYRKAKELFAQQAKRVSV